MQKRRIRFHWWPIPQVSFWPILECGSICITDIFPNYSLPIIRVSANMRNFKRSHTCVRKRSNMQIKSAYNPHNCAKKLHMRLHYPHMPKLRENFLSSNVSDHITVAACSWVRYELIFDNNELININWLNILIINDYIKKTSWINL